MKSLYLNIYFNKKLVKDDFNQSKDRFYTKHPNTTEMGKKITKSQKIY